MVHLIDCLAFQPHLQINGVDVSADKLHDDWILNTNGCLAITTDESQFIAEIHLDGDLERLCIATAPLLVIVEHSTATRIHLPGKCSYIRRSFAFSCGGPFVHSSTNTKESTYEATFLVLHSLLSKLRIMWAFRGRCDG
ncbi:hypothetical protein HNY73_003375 [Argiope bruennichi]|uniref:Uncharacterized protein n=1 Tax=Argiope bruennichi TaxID=94029 RepID=A0A8T0FQD6_ARGBR|nr:hypothetical protein HNY73_003375 [Argiope bruennichi]